MIVNFDKLKRRLIALWIINWGLSALAVSANEKSQPGDLVEWKSWAEVQEEALKGLDKPLFFAVSHELNPMSEAMRTESFRNESIASRLNGDYLPIRVNKNEHPILAEFLLSYVQAAKQISKWPLNVLTTSAINPIEGGGYYPPTDDWGSQGLLSVVDRIAEHWKAERDDVVEGGKESLKEMEYTFGVSSNEIHPFEGKLIKLSAENLSVRYDEINAGFGLPPKAVSFGEIRLLDLAVAQDEPKLDQLKIARDSTLRAMVLGAMRDYVRGGFYTATIDEKWSIPDFRKSVLVQADAIHYLSAYPEYEIIVKETAQVLVDDFRGESGFYSEHISFPGEEAEIAAANTWTYKELSAILNKSEFERFTRLFGVLKEGNVPEDLDFSGMFKGRNILKPVGEVVSDRETVSALQALGAKSRSKFSVEREKLSSISTNAIVASCLVKAGKEFEDEAKRLLNAIVDTFWDEEHLILRAATRDGKALSPEASSKGYALFVRALLDAAADSHESDYLVKAVEIQKALDEKFRSPVGAYLIAPKSTSDIPLNLNAFYEDEMGSANSVTVRNLLRLHNLYPDSRYRDAVAEVIKNLPENVSYFPEDFSDMLVGISLYESVSSHVGDN
ncbi:MAG: hypothetical protein ACI92G_000662 [Candidatus Pelagisphaera sp.]|jgi:uncharacterized protein YyaL (SSP411 family)